MPLSSSPLLGLNHCMWAVSSPVSGSKQCSVGRDKYEMRYEANIPPAATHARTHLLAHSLTNSLIRGRGREVVRTDEKKRVCRGGGRCCCCGKNSYGEHRLAGWLDDWIGGWVGGRAG